MVHRAGPIYTPHDEGYIVYLLRRPEPIGKPLYIGYGKTSRPYDHWMNYYSSPAVAQIVRSDMGRFKSMPTVEVLADHLSRAEALYIEAAFIMLYGRQCVGEGPLVNISAGSRYG